jgi:hypothetical protein
MVQILEGKTFSGLMLAGRKGLWECHQQDGIGECIVEAKR